MLNPMSQLPLYRTWRGGLNLARSGTLPGALDGQLLALERRRWLNLQQAEYRQEEGSQPAPVPPKYRRRPGRPPP